ncbi:DsbA family protein [Neptunomonas sp.]|uniref:DsbA family protein n=1 Tax=Neptunomonas sp. TaxID=1971898 RepID=UPI0025E3249B|nr:DsbA family protein [Neptunomonas sp.]
MQLLYIMDPMCSWCWAFSPTIDAIKQQFPNLPITYVMGGLAADSESTMPAEQQEAIQSIWSQIEAKTGTRFNHDFWTKCTPRRSTWQACRAILAAENIQSGAAPGMARAIQHAYYLEAKNPSDNATLIALAESLGIDPSEFSKQLNSTSIQQEFEENLRVSQQLDVSGFPALRLLEGQQATRVSDGYSSPDDVIKRLNNTLKAGNRG